MDGVKEGGQRKDRCGGGERWTTEVGSCQSLRRERGRTGSNRFSFHGVGCTEASAEEKNCKKKR